MVLSLRRCPHLIDTTALVLQLLHAVRQLVVPACGALGTQLWSPSQVLLVDRKNASCRRWGFGELVALQSAVQSQLQSSGFHAVRVRIVVCEELAVSEQVLAFAASAVVIGVHGAGLANCIWMRGGMRGGQLIEVLPVGPMQVASYSLPMMLSSTDQLSFAGTPTTGTFHFLASGHVDRP
eukprot:SAG31_NODE_979_length_10600_cov_13.736025_14_plen_180_part_00